MMSFGPQQGPLRRPSLLVFVLVAALVLAGLATWRFWPRPPPDLTTEDLTGAYAGMVRADGTNQVSTLTAADLTEPPARIRPARCAPLFEATVSNQFPPTALEGVSTYWLKEGSASISLTTYRYADSDAARRQFVQVSDTLAACVGTRLRVDRRSNVSVEQQTVTPPDQADDYVSFLAASPPGNTRVTIDVARLTNTVSWQYRYDYQSRERYTPLAAQQLMASLMSQLRDIQKSRR